MDEMGDTNYNKVVQKRTYSADDKNNETEKSLGGRYGKRL